MCVPDDFVPHGGHLRHGDEEPSGAPDVRVLGQVVVPEVVVEVLGVVEAAQQAPFLEVLDALAPVPLAPVVRVQPAGQRYRGEAARGRGQELDLVDVIVLVDVVAHTDGKHPQLSAWE